MNRATPEMREFAERLLTAELKRRKFAETKSTVPFVLFEKMRPYLETLMGKGGFRALFSRALALASAELPGLRALQVKGDGSLEGLEQMETDLDPDQIFEGRVVLLAHLLGLMVTFIGENLTLRLLREDWPKLSLSDLYFDKGGKNEKGK